MPNECTVDKTLIKKIKPISLGIRLTVFFDLCDVYDARRHGHWMCAFVDGNRELFWLLFLLGSLNVFS